MKLEAALVGGLVIPEFNGRRLRSTPAMALGIADRVWTVGNLLDAALAAQPITPAETPAKRRSRFKVIQGDLFE